MPDWLLLLIGVAAGGAAVWAILLRHGQNRYQQGRNEGKAERARLEERLAQAQRQMDEERALLKEAEKRLSDSFKALSAEALRTNNQSFLDLAKSTLEKYQEGARDDLTARQKAIEQLTQPIRERLEKFDGKLDDLEKARHGAYKALDQQLRTLVEVDLPRLHAETSSLVRALRQPATRGRWGEVQLRRVVEMAGMLEHCDFDEQVSRTTEEGRLRPDLIVRLPGARNIVVDAKVPIEAYLQAIEAKSDEERDQELRHHATQVRDHMTALGRKSYFDQFDPAPDFVVMFIPGEAFFSAALAADAGLIEYGADQKVIPASPTTLIALLKSVAYGWRQEALAENAAEVAALGRELYNRLQTLAGHWSNVGRRLDQAVEAYNSSVSSLETRLLPSARRFQDLKVALPADGIEQLNPVERAPRPLTAPEMSGNASGETKAEENGPPDSPTGDGTGSAAAR